MPTPGEGYVLDVSMKAQEAISQYAVVIYGSVAGFVQNPAAAKDANIVGVAQEASTASGDVIRVRKLGYSYVEAGASASVGTPLAIHDTVGRVSRPTAFVSGDGYVGEYDEAPTASGEQVVAFINPRELVR